MTNNKKSKIAQIPVSCTKKEGGNECIGNVFCEKPHGSRWREISESRYWKLQEMGCFEEWLGFIHDGVHLDHQETKNGGFIVVEFKDVFGPSFNPRNLCNRMS